MTPPAPSSFERLVHFYHLETKTRPGRGKRSQINQAAPKGIENRLRDLADDHPGQALFVENKYYTPQTIDGCFVMGIHRLLDPTFLSEVDGEAHRVRDFSIDSAENSKQLAMSTACAVRVVDDRLTFAIATGSGTGCPRQAAVTKFFNAHFNPGPGTEWQHRSILTRPDIKAVKNSDGVVSMKLAYREGTELDLASFQDSPHAAALAMGHFLGGETRVNLDVSLNGTDDQAQAQASRKLRDTVLQMIPLLRSGARSQVTAVEDGQERTIHLVESELASVLHLSPNEVIGANFTALLQRTARILDSESHTIAEVFSKNGMPN